MSKKDLGLISGIYFLYIYVYSKCSIQIFLTHEVITI